MKFATNTRRVLMFALVIVSTVSVLSAPVDAKKRQCETIKKCRTSIAWNHAVIADLNARLAMADGRPAGGRVTPICHKLLSCQATLRRQQDSRIWAEGAWTRLMHDNSVTGAERIVRYQFTRCGGAVKAQQAHDIVGWESDWYRFNVNAAGDSGWWQIELPAHPEVSLTEAEDAWTSTGIAVRWSHCGDDWSPTWSSVRDHGMSWD